MKLNLMPPFIFQALRVVVFTYSNKYIGCSTTAARVNGMVYKMYDLETVALRNRRQGYR